MRWLKLWWNLPKRSVEDNSMISFTPIDAIHRAEGLLESVAHRNSLGPPSPEDVVHLVEAKQQVTAAVHLFDTEDDLTRRILDVLA